MKKLAIGLTVLIGMGGLTSAAQAHKVAGADRGDRIDHRLDRKGDRIERRYDKRAAVARANGRDKVANKLERRGNRIDNRLDRKGDRIDRRLDKR